MAAAHGIRRPRVRPVVWNVGAGLGSGAALAVPALALAIGYAVPRSPALAAALVGTIVVGVSVGSGGRLRFAQIALGALPWLIVTGDLLPPLVKTFASAAAAISLLLLVGGIRVEGRMLYVGALLFLGCVLVGTLLAVSGAQLIQAAKYMIFPAMAIAVTNRHAREILPRLRTAVLGSGLAAMGFHTVVLAVGLGTTQSHYNIGAKVGFAESPHELALFGLVIAAAGLTTAKRLTSRVAYVAIALLPALATGVRTALLAVLVLCVLFIVKYRLSPRALTLVAAVMALAVVSGVTGIIDERFRVEQAEDATLATAGSGRPSIWKVAFERWEEGGPDAWLFGTGLRSIKQITLEELGAEFVGHSDIVEVGVQLGLVGLVGWLLIWLALLMARLESLVLIPIAVYGVTNGAMEYGAPLVVGITLAAACASPGKARSHPPWRGLLPRSESSNGAGPQPSPVARTAG
jgi:O-antigen ligase